MVMVYQMLILDKLVEFHKSHGKIATMTAVNVGQQFGVLEIDENGTINKFREKSIPTVA